jgi:hypothetical protein
MPEPESREPFSEAPTATKMPWMVGLFDVLGFSSRIAQDGVEKVYETYRSLIDRVLKKEALRCIGSMRLPGESHRVPTLFSAEVRYTYFSDTILLWMPLHPMFAGPFLQRCSDLVCEALQMQIPLRGTISLGEGFMHKQSGTYLGSMIVEAARLEAAQEWLGVAFGPSATWTQFVAEVSPTQIIEYDIPVKEGKESLCSPIALDWPRRWRDTETISLQKRLGEITPVGQHSKYYAHALAFADWSEKHHDWHKQTADQNQFKHLHMRLESEVLPATPKKAQSAKDGRSGLSNCQ